MRTKLDIAICGCGPAGLAAALLLTRSGHRVHLFERFEAPQPVGSGLILQPTGLGVLAELGLAAKIAEHGAVINRLFGRVAPSGRVVLDVRYSAMGDGWHGIAVHRAALFDVVYDAVCAARISISTSTAIASSECSGAKRILYRANGQSLGAFDLVVDALGSRSALKPASSGGRHLAYGALWANVPYADGLAFAGSALEQRYFRASRMAGVLPIGSRAEGAPQQAAFFWSIRQQDVAAWRAGGLERWKDEVRAFWPEASPFLDGIKSADDLTLAQYEHFTLVRPYGERLAHIGDAGHSTSPQLGQGANMALLDALALARALDDHAEISTALEAYGRMRRWHVRLFQLASAAFTPFYQSDSQILPVIRDWVAAPLSRLPVADAMLARLVSGLTIPPLGSSKFQPFRNLPRGEINL
jgi:salicylate hydroxylase